MKFPQILVEPTGLVISLDSADEEIRVIKMEMVLDIDDSGIVSGIEILDVMRCAGVNCLDLMRLHFGEATETRRFSFDPDSDAFYFTLSRGRSSNQEVVVGQVALNRLGQIVRISCPRQNMSGE